MAEIRGLRFTYKGSEYSGNFGHAGRPGQVGGSQPGGWRAIPIGSHLTPKQRQAIDQEVIKINERLTNAIPKSGWIEEEEIVKKVGMHVQSVVSQLSLWELQGKVEQRYDKNTGKVDWRWRK